MITKKTKKQQKKNRDIEQYEHGEFTLDFPVLNMLTEVHSYMLNIFSPFIPNSGKFFCLNS